MLSPLFENLIKKNVLGYSKNKQKPTVVEF